MCVWSVLDSLVQTQDRHADACDRSVLLLLVQTWTDTLTPVTGMQYEVCLVCTGFAGSNLDRHADACHWFVPVLVVRTWANMLTWPATGPYWFHVFELVGSALYLSASQRKLQKMGVEYSILFRIWTQSIDCGSDYDLRFEPRPAVWTRHGWFMRPRFDLHLPVQTSGV